MQRPFARVVRFKGDGHVPTWRNQHGVAHCARKAFAVDRDYLEVMPVQVHRMGHGGPIFECDLDPLACAHFQRGVIAMSSAQTMAAVRLRQAERACRRG